MRSECDSDIDWARDGCWLCFCFLWVVKLNGVNWCSSVFVHCNARSHVSKQNSNFSRASMEFKTRPTPVQMLAGLLVAIRQRHITPLGTYRSLN